MSSVAVRTAKERYRLDVFQGTVEDIDWQGKVFDNISVFHVLEHVHDPTALLQHCHSLLSDGGILVVAVPNEVSSLRAYAKRVMINAGLKERNGLGRFGLPVIGLGPRNEEVHLSHFTPKVLYRLLQNNGFSILKKTLDPYRLGGQLQNRLKATSYYFCCLAIMQVCRINIYDTMLVIARKETVSPPDSGCKLEAA